MGEFLNQVKARQNAPEAIAHRIALYLSTPDKRAIVVEAGDDQHFYYAMLRRLSPKRAVQFYSGHGRVKVFKVLDILSDLSKSDRTYAIVDRDLNLDDPPTLYSEHCLVLNIYSYENYFGDLEVLCDIAKMSFGLEAEAAQMLLWRSMTENFLRTLPASLEQEHALAYGCQLTSANCNLSNFRVTQYLNVSNDGSVFSDPDTTQHFIRETNLNIKHFSSEDILLWEQKLSTIPWKVRFRGHFFWEMFTKFLNTFRIQLDREFAEEKRSRTRTRNELTARHVIEAATSLIPSPLDVESFLKTVID